jgi:hypothetical protein
MSSGQNRGVDGVDTERKDCWGCVHGKATKAREYSMPTRLHSIALLETWVETHNTRATKSGGYEYIVWVILVLQLGHGLENGKASLDSSHTRTDNKFCYSMKSS